MELRLLFLCLYTTVVLCAIPNPSRFSTYLLQNRWESGLPLSYYVPPGYYQSIPLNQRPQPYTTGENEPQCGGIYVDADLMNGYTFQTEELLTTAGLNLYDGAMWQLSVSLLGYTSIADEYQENNLIQRKTLQFPNIKADRPCKGVIQWGQCTDSQEDGGCGFCYGDTINTTLNTDNAYFFRMVSDVWSFDGTQDVRCPTLNGQTNTWKWNDYRPVTGENSWASLIGPLQVAYIKANKIIDNIPDSDSAFELALEFVPAVEAMLIVTNGAIYYAPRNTWDSSDPTIGDSVSTENAASLLAGLKMFLYILSHRSSPTYQSWVPRVQNLVNHITNYIHSSYNYQYGYFSQGGKFDARTKTWTWVQEPFFAVDCQTWVITVLGKELIDSWFGEGTTLGIWNNTKRIGGYMFNPTSTWVSGVGFTDNTKDQVFSGEWSLGAINMLYVLANSYTGPEKSALQAEAAFMRLALENDLVKPGSLDGIPATGVYYSNKRYYIPFGWYANPLWSTASVGWTVTTDLQFNPFYLGGALQSVYPK
jgi:hypothetical protein